MQRRCLRDVLAIDQTFRVTYSNTNSWQGRGEKGKAKRQKAIKQKPLDGKQFSAAIFSINTLLGGFFLPCNCKLIILLLLEML